MKLSTKVSVFALGILFLFGIAVLVRAATFVDLDTAEDFAVLAGSAISDAGASVINGDVGLSPTTGAAITGLTAVQVTGTIYAVDAAGPAGSIEDPGLLTIAKNDLTAAYLDAAGQTPVSTVPSELGGTTKFAGVYDSADGEFGITGTLTLDAQGDPDAIFIFKAASTLTTANSSVVSLMNGAQACNVFWQIGSSAATLGGSSIFKGSLLALTSITLGTAANIEGRILARNGAVTLDGNIITVPTCSSPVPPATLHVIKLVVGGTATPADFNVHVQLSGVEVAGSPQDGAAAPGTLYTLSPGTYTVSEDVDPLYTQSFFGADCVPGGSMVLASGEDYICTIINTTIPPPGPVQPSSGGGGGSSRIVPLIGIVKVPTPLALPEGEGEVTYDYTVRNVGGEQALVDVTVTDDKCSQIDFLSGDSNNDGKLDVNEVWKYSCTTTIENTTINTAIATGYSDDSLHEATIATAIATVVVGGTIPPPLIDIVKVPSRLTPFPFGGGSVTYTYTVTNPGVVSMHDVTVTDDKCGPVSRISSDINGNSLLDPGESWVYSCQTSIGVSTNNVATATGEANGFTAIDYAFATVLVSAPGLPNTGFGYDVWNILIPIVILVALFLFYLARKKRTV